MKIQILKFSTLFMIVITSLFINTLVYGQSPNTMSYQAVIRGSSNTLVVSHAVGMRISILQGSVTGTEVYTETQTPTTNANGLVSIEIGNGPGFAGINWAAGPYFIKTETDPTGGSNYTITGTSQLLSVPYSLNAKTAETADYNTLSNLPTLNIANWNTAFGWGNHGTAGYLTSFTETDPIWNTASSNYFTKTNMQTSGSSQLHFDNLTNKPTTVSGYGITDAMTNSHVANGITASDITNWNTAFGWGNHSLAGYLTSFTELDPKIGANTTNYISKWDGTALISSSIYDDGTKIGIGTTTPGAKLDIVGQVKITGGAPGTGKVLTSDANGLATWENKTGYISNYGYASGGCTTPTTVSVLTWCGPKVTLVITSTTQKVLVTACLTLGAGSVAANGLAIYPAYGLTSSTNPTTVGYGTLGYSCPANTRSSYTTTAVITGLAPGTYYFGACVSVNNLNWTNNEYGNVTAIIIN